jgi:excisionase family DNA binding protein
MTIRHAPAGYLTAREAADLLGISRYALNQWADQGLLASTRTLGGHRRFASAEVRACRRRMRWLAELEVALEELRPITDVNLPSR